MSHLVRLLFHIELLFDDKLNFGSQLDFRLSEIVQQLLLDVDLVHHFPSELLRAKSILDEHIVNHQEGLLVLCDRLGLACLVGLAHGGDNLQSGAEQLLESRFSLFELAVARQPLLFFLLELVVECDPLINQGFNFQQVARDSLQRCLELFRRQLTLLDLLFLGLELAAHSADRLVDVGDLVLIAVGLESIDRDGNQLNHQREVL